LKRAAIVRLWAILFSLIFLVLSARADSTLGIAAYQRGDFLSAFKEFSGAAETGDAVAARYLGVILLAGLGVPVDERKAADLFANAAAAGDAEASFRLGLLYETGIGVPKDERRSLVLYRAAAEQGHAVAQYSLGNLLERARNQRLPRDYPKAAGWYRKSAAQGYAPAQTALAWLYYYGYGVTRDDAQAIALMSAAAATGYPPAQRDLAKVLLDSDPPKAISWLRKAANQGDVLAVALWGSLMLDGKVVPEDRIAGYAFLSWAAGAGLLQARQLLPDVAALLTSVERQSAEMLLLDWQPGQPLPER